MTQHTTSTTGIRLAPALASTRAMATTPATAGTAATAPSTPPAGHAGHGGHSGHGDHVQRFRRLFWLMLVLAVPVVALSPMFAMLLGYEVLDGGLIAWVRPCSARSCTPGAVRLLLAGAMDEPGPGGRG
ncbi:MAG: hypothetical protein U0R79_10745 [Propionicimonas sp.]